MHNRWECPNQRTHYLANDSICALCRCYVCNISLQICGVNSHKWAAPPTVLNWEKMRPKQQAWEAFEGRELCKLHFPVQYVNNELVMTRTGVESATLVAYMSKPVNAAIWNYLKDAVGVQRQGELSRICQHLRDSTILCYMGHDSYMNMTQMKGPLLFSLQWLENSLELIIRARGSAWDILDFPVYGRLPIVPAPARPGMPFIDSGRVMFPHQEEALRDMLYVEQHSVLHAFWNALTLPGMFMYKHHTPMDWLESRQTNLFLQGSQPPDSMVYGGFLCNDRGTGKTFVTAALIRAHPAPLTSTVDSAAMQDDDDEVVLFPTDSDSEAAESEAPGTSEPKVFVRQTLILVPAANLLPQWVDELQALQLNVVVHHGKTRIQTLEDLESCDVVVTTFDTFRALWYNNSKTVFHSVTFWRVVLDECHRLLQGQSLTRAGAAAVELSARNRWGLTATPDATFSRTRILTQLIAGVGPRPGYYSERSLVHRFIQFPDRYHIPQREDIFNRLVILHNAEANVMPEVRFTPLAITLEKYDQYQQIIQRVQQIGSSLGGMYLVRTFNNILATINGIGPMKWPSEQQDASQRPEVPADVYDCSICLDALHHPMRSACQHYFCRTCITQWLNTANACPLCRGQAKPLVPCMEIVADADTPVDFSLPPSGAKAAALIQHIERILAQPDDQGEPHRVLVFSRYLQMRNLLQNMLGPVATSDIGEFHAGRAQVLIMSYLSGSVGLNLMQANHVVLCEPCFRASTEEQAYGRAARLGQRRVVHVYPVYLQGTIEETMVQLPRRVALNMQQAFFYGAPNNVDY